MKPIRIVDDVLGRRRNDIGVYVNHRGTITLIQNDVHVAVPIDQAAELANTIMSCAGHQERETEDTAQRVRADQRSLNDRPDPYNGQATIDDYMKHHTQDTKCQTR